MNLPRNQATLALAADTGELRRAAAWLHSEAGAHQVPEADIARLDICLHEALANIIDHGGLAADATIGLQLEVAEGRAALTLSDAGRRYDPTAAALPQRPTTLAETLPGGLGVVMLRSQSDRLDYQYRDGCNQLCITVCWSAA